MRARLLFVMIASVGAVSAATACSSPDVAAESEAKRATQASAVSISMFDKAGTSLGTCSGTLVAKDLVLTAGHCAAGAAKWSITAKGADATSEANRAVTPWKAFGSDLSHPDHSDVALLILDTPIALDSYPAIATSKLADGAKALRFSRASASAGEPASSEIAVSNMTKKGFRLNYAAKIDKGAYLDTGGAIIDPKTGKIHGVVSGVGNESGLLHIARTDNFAKWITNAKSCTSATSLATRTYGTTSSGGSSGWGGGSSSWGGGSGDWGGYGGSGDKLDGGGASSGSSGSWTAAPAARARRAPRRAPRARRAPRVPRAARRGAPVRPAPPGARARAAATPAARAARAPASRRVKAATVPACPAAEPVAEAAGPAAPAEAAATTTRPARAEAAEPAAEAAAPAAEAAAPAAEAAAPAAPAEATARTAGATRCAQARRTAPSPTARPVPARHAAAAEASPGASTRQSTTATAPRVARRARERPRSFASPCAVGGGRATIEVRARVIPPDAALRAPRTDSALRHARRRGSRSSRRTHDGAALQGPREGLRQE